MSIFGSRSKSRQSRSVDIPDFLQPFVTQSAGTAGRALSSLERLGPENLVSEFTPEQEIALQLATGRAFGADGFIPTAQDQFLRTAQGVPISEFLPAGVTDSLSGFGRAPEDVLGADVIEALTRSGVLPSSSVNTLTGAQNAGLPFGSDALSIDPNIASFLPAVSQDTLTRLSGPQTPRNTDALLSILNRSSVPDAATAALQRTAEGDFLFGGEGFDQAVDAAVRAALPQIRSVFGSAGAGGATGGLAQTAVGQAAIDAFASRFGEERGRQLSAADRLATLGLDESRLSLAAQDALEGQSLARNAQSLGAADVLGRLGLDSRGQAIDAGSRLAGIDLSNRSLRQGAAETLANLGLLQSEQGIQGAGLLADFIGGERQRELSASGLLADIANTERGRSLEAARALPDVGLLDVNLLDQVGGTRQAQAEREARAPLDFNQLLLAAALGGLPIESLLGDTTSGRSRRFGFSLGDSDG